MKAFTVACLSLFAAAVFAQETPELPKPTMEHEWLKQFVGEWETENEAQISPDQKMKCKGTMKAKMLGGFWMISETKGDMMGTTVDAIQTIGYDPEKEMYVGSWVDSMMNHMWKYEGSVDKTGKILTLEAEGPSMTEPGKTARYRDVYEFKSKDQIAMTSATRGEDGEWITFMNGTAKRKK